MSKDEKESEKLTHKSALHHRRVSQRVAIEARAPVLCQWIAGQHEGRFQENLRVFYEVLDKYSWCADEVRQFPEKL